MQCDDGAILKPNNCGTTSQHHHNFKGEMLGWMSRVGVGVGGLFPPVSTALGHMPMRAYEEDHKDTLSLQVSLQSEMSHNTDDPVTTSAFWSGQANRTAEPCVRHQGQ